MKKLTLAIAALACSVLAPAGQAADLAAGKAAFEKYTCMTCHGEDAKTSTLPSYPVLAGQHADYIAHSLRAYKRGQEGVSGANVRVNAVMGAMAQQLSDADIANISAWLASLPSPLGVRR